MLMLLAGWYELGHTDVVLPSVRCTNYSNNFYVHDKVPANCDWQGTFIRVLYRSS